MFIKSKVTRRQACPYDPGAPQVELVDGGVFDVTPHTAEYLVSRGEAEYILAKEEAPTTQEVKEEKPKRWGARK